MASYKEIKKAGVVDEANYTITGELTMLGTAKDISFPTRITLKDEKMDAEALIRISRIDWGMDYASEPTADMQFYRMLTYT
ncbi:MAG: YceI family protein [Pedobacter sp.]|nr:MAG: YceI family protein [Pedobacter sp.]